ncbi:MAG: metal-sensitive transcriptional regulator [Candidatus Omnitrophota bacterium]
MKQGMVHKDQIIFLKRIEGQVRGVLKMIEERRYCVDILTQLHSIVGAILRVEDKVMRKHLEGCVSQSLKSKSALERNAKIDEVMGLIKRFRRGM